MQTVLKWFASLSRAGAIVAGWALLAISFATVVEILGRKYFNFSFRSLDEIGGYMLAGVSAFGFAYALSKHSHMRVTLLFPYIPPSVQSVLNAFAMVSLAAMAAFCAWRGGIEVLEHLTTGKRSNTPLSVQQLPGWSRYSWATQINVSLHGAVRPAIPGRKRGWRK